MRSLSELAVRSLAGTEGATYPFWSADSRSIAFFADGELRRIRAGGGTVDTICDTPQGRGGTWNRSDVIVFAPGEGPLMQVPASGGTPTMVRTAPDATPAEGPRWPYFLADGRHFLYLGAGREKGSYAVRLGSLDSSYGELLRPEASNAAYAPPGYLLFVRSGNLMAVNFDSRKRRVSGEPTVIADSVHQHHYRFNADFSVSETGILAYYGGDLANRSQLQWYDQQGHALGRVGERAQYGGLRLSPDGSRCAVEIRDPRTSAIDIWLLDLKRQLMTRLTSGSTVSDSPIWSSDGKQILFTADRGGVWNIYRRASADMGDELVFASKLNKVPTDWSPDGRFVALRQDSEESASDPDIWMLSLADRSARPFVRSPFKESEARFSPDGHSIAYVSDETGRPEVYVRSFPAGADKIRVSASGGTQPLWARNGSEIFYVSAGDKLMVAPIRAGPSPEVGEPKVLFSLLLTPSASDNPRYAVSADGQRVLVNTPGTAEAATVVVQLNWMAGLKR